jgi:dolichol-phosphate mannosyltransferase
LTSEYELSIVIPTYNEVSNIKLIIEAIQKTLNNKVKFEIIVVDDNSTDGTWDLAEKFAGNFENIICFRRITSKGLSSAVIDGFMISKSKFVAVIDADLQHDETILLKMLDCLRTGIDLAVGSRYCEDASVGDWKTGRKFVSKVATKLGQSIGNVNLSDPMSGFFMIKKDIFLDVADKLNGKGYKILLDIVSQFNEDKKIIIQDVPYTFKSRLHGESKLTPEVVFQLVDFLYLRLFGNYIPIDYMKFISVGALGAMIHFAVLYIAHILLQYSFQTSLIVAIETSLILNYFINNIWTFKAKTHRGFAKLIGLLKFNLLSGIGGLISYYISIALFESGINWVFASIVGAIVASLWNYNLNRILTWNAS